MAPKIKYLTNKELLSEIHKSKISYCSFTNIKYSTYDAIVVSLDKITKRLIKQIQTKKAELLTKQKKTELKLSGAKPQEIEKMKPVKAKDIPVEQIVFRVMTYEHIPLDTQRKRKARTDSERYVRLNFPPFKHYVLINGTPKEVGRSHWKGTFSSGAFCQEHGKISDILASMFMRLVEKYSQRGNWRNYTYLDEMKCQALLQLAHIGLRFDESRSNNPFSYYTAAVSNSFTRILNVEKRNQNIRDDILIMHGESPSYTRQVEHSISQRNEE